MCMKSAAGTVILAVMVAAGPAFASDRDATASERDRVVKHLTSKGYTQISDVDVDHGRFEVDAISPSGADVDVILNMTTLKVVREDRS